MEIAGDPGELACQSFDGHDLLDLIDGRLSRFPRRLRMVTSESILELMESQVSHIGQMGGGMSGLRRTKLIALKESDPATHFPQQVGHGYSGDPASYHHDIDMQILFEAGKGPH